MLYCWCHSDSASVLLYFTLLTVQVRWASRFCFTGVLCISFLNKTSTDWIHIFFCLLVYFCFAVYQVQFQLHSAITLHYNLLLVKLRGVLADFQTSRPTRITFDHGQSIPNTKLGKKKPGVKLSELSKPLVQAKEKYRGMFENEKSGDKTRSGEIGLDIRTNASPKVGQDQVSGEVSVLCLHAAPVAYVLWKPCTIR